MPPTQWSTLSPKAVDVVFDGGYLTELNRFNSTSTTGTPVSNSTYEYRDNRKIGLISHFAASGVSGNISTESPHYDAYGRVEATEYGEGGSFDGQMIYTRDASGKVVKVAELESNATSTTNVQNFDYDSKGALAGSNEAYSRQYQDGNNRYEYDKEGNVNKRWRLETQAANLQQLSLTSSYGSQPYGPNIYFNYVEHSQDAAPLLTGWHRLQLSPVQVSAPVPDDTLVVVTLQAVSNGTTVIDEQEYAFLKEVSAGKLVLDRTVSFDKYLAYSSSDYEIKFKLEFLNYSTLNETFHVTGQLSLGHYEGYSEYKHDNRNRIIEAKVWSIDHLYATSLRHTQSNELLTESYQYDALGNRVRVGLDYFSNGAGSDDRTYLFENGKPLLEFSEGGKLERERFYIAELDQLVAVEDFDFAPDGSVSDTDVIWTLNNRQGSVTAVYESASQFRRFHYNQHGLSTDDVPRDSTDSNNWFDAVTVGYMAMEFDSDTGLYLAGNRAYNPSGGRYLTPTSFTSGPNALYAFAGNSSVDRTSPSLVNTYSGSTDSGWDIFNEEFGKRVNPRIFGASQVLFGVAEVVGGFITSPTLVGALVSLHGLDDIWTGGWTVITGEFQDSITHRIAYAATGSETLATVVDVGAGLASGAAAARISRLAKAADAALPAQKLASRTMSKAEWKQYNRQARIAAREAAENAPNTGVHIGAVDGAFGTRPTMLSHIGVTRQRGNTCVSSCLDMLLPNRRATSTEFYNITASGLKPHNVRPFIANNIIEAGMKPVTGSFEEALRSGKRFIAFVDDPVVGGHAVLVEGVERVNGIPNVLVRDPARGAYLENLEWFTTQRRLSSEAGLDFDAIWIDDLPF